MFQTNELRIRSLFIRETGTYNPQWRRPYETNLQGNVLNSLIERLGGAKTLDATLMGGVANQFIRPTPGPEKEIAMIHGWNEPRMRFLMEVECKSSTGGVVSEIIAGYTDYLGASLSGNFDHRMEFFVNSTIQLRRSNEMAAFGQRNMSMVANSSHVIVDNDWNNLYKSNREYKMRPEDVFTNMGAAQIAPFSQDGGLCDGRTLVTSTAVKSKRANATATSYMSEILRGYTAANEKSEFGQHPDQIQSIARGITRESVASKDMFLSAIAQIRGTPIGNTFTFNDLMRLDPGAEHVTNVSVIGHTERANIHAAGMTSDWSGSDIFTHMASILSQTVPGLLMDLAITEIVFKSTNRTVDGNILTTIYDANGFNGCDISRQLETFKLKLEYEVIRDITHENQVDYAVEMRVNLIGETWLSLSLDGKPFIDYVTPSFADALLTPIITNDNQRAIRLASDFDTLTTHLIDANQPQMRSNMFGGSILNV